MTDPVRVTDPVRDPWAASRTLIGLTMLGRVSSMRRRVQGSVRDLFRPQTTIDEPSVDDCFDGSGDSGELASSHISVTSE